MTDQPVLPEGHLLNEYRIERVLGGGGFGVTYLAHDTNLDCPVAIKEYLPKDVAVRRPDFGVEPRSDDARRAFEWACSAFCSNPGRWRASTTRASCGCCATSWPTTPPTW